MNNQFRNNPAKSHNQFNILLKHISLLKWTNQPALYLLTVNGSEMERTFVDIYPLLQSRWSHFIKKQNKTGFNSLYISLLLLICETLPSGKTTKKTKNNGLRIKKYLWIDRYSVGVLKEKKKKRPCSVAKDVKLLYTWHYDSRQPKEWQLSILTLLPGNHSKLCEHTL